VNYLFRAFSIKTRKHFLDSRENLMKKNDILGLHNEAEDRKYFIS